MKDLVSVLLANGIDIQPNFAQVRQRKGSQYLFNQTFQIRGRDVHRAIYGDFKTNIMEEWISDTALSPEEKVEFAAAVEKRSSEEEAFKLEQWALAKEEAKLFLQTKCSDRGTTEYTQRKRIKLHNGKIFTHEKYGSLVLAIFMQDTNDEIWNYQKIFPVKLSYGDKFFMKGARIEGLFHPFGFTMEDNPLEIYIAEGFATAATVFEATNTPTVAAFTAYNMVKVAVELRKKYPDSRLILCADNDQFTINPKTKAPTNPGIHYATKACTEANGILRYPVFKDLSTRPTDLNDLYLLYGMQEVVYQLQQDRSTEAPPITDTKSKPNKKPNEIKLARALFEAEGGRFIKQEKDLFLYQTTHWELASENIKSKIRNLIRELSDMHYTSRDVGSAFNTFMDLVPSVPKCVDMFAGNPMAANFKNGTLHLRRTTDHAYTTEFTPHSREDYITNVLPFDYKPESTEENAPFMEMLNRIWKDEPDREEKIRLYGQVMGACLLGAFPMIVLFIGSPGSGKSTLLKLAARLVDHDNLCFVDPVHFEGFNMETMVNKLVNVVTDLNTRRPIADEVVKQIVDRQRIRFRRKGIKDIEGYLPPIHLWAANEFPKSLEGAVGSYDRRAIILRTEKFQVKSLDTYHKDFPEWVWDQSPQGIINFAVRGAMDLIGRRGHYSVPESSRGEMQKWSHESDPVGMFLRAIELGELTVGNDRVIIDLEAQISGPQIWECFKQWFKDTFNGDTRLSKPKLFERLEREGYERDRVKDRRFWSGIGVRVTRDATG